MVYIYILQLEQGRHYVGKTNDELILAIDSGDEEKVTRLLEQPGIDVNVRNIDGETALIRAVENGNIDISKMLVEAGADVNVRNNDGNTALILASRTGKEAIVEMLLTDNSYWDDDGIYRIVMVWGTDVNARNNDGETALIRAVENGNIDISKMLLDAGADVNVRNNDGNTALILASRTGKEAIVEMLLTDNSYWDDDGIYRIVMAWGTDVNAMNNEGETALWVASDNSDTGDIGIMLLDAGADDGHESDDEPDNESAHEPQTDNMTRLLVRDKVSLEKTETNPFTELELERFELELERFDPILQENVQLCDYVNDDKENLLFIFNRQVAMIEKSRIKMLIAEDTLDTNKIIYQCKKTDQAFRPRDENIIGGPALNMDIITLFGVMVPLSYLDEVVNGKHQIYVIEPTNANQTMPIASLNTRLGGNVIGANHGQAEVAIQVSKLTYVDNDVLIGMCKKGNINKENKTFH